MNAIELFESMDNLVDLVKNAKLRKDLRANLKQLRTMIPVETKENPCKVQPKSLADLIKEERLASKATPVETSTVDTLAGLLYTVDGGSVYGGTSRLINFSKWRRSQARKAIQLSEEYEKVLKAPMSASLTFIYEGNPLRTLGAITAKSCFTTGVTTCTIVSMTVPRLDWMTSDLMHDAAVIDNDKPRIQDLSQTVFRSQYINHLINFINGGMRKNNDIHFSLYDSLGGVLVQMTYNTGLIVCFTLGGIRRGAYNS